MLAPSSCSQPPSRHLSSTTSPPPRTYLAAEHRRRTAHVKVRVRTVLLVELRNELVAVGRSHAAEALIIKHAQQAVRLLGQQLDAGHVVRKGGPVPLDGFALVLGRLLLEDNVVEQPLQLLVGRVDEELLESVDLHILKAKLRQGQRTPFMKQSARACGGSAQHARYRARRCSEAPSGRCAFPHQTPCWPR